MFAACLHARCLACFDSVKATVSTACIQPDCYCPRDSLNSMTDVTSRPGLSKPLPNLKDRCAVLAPNVAACPSIHQADACVHEHFLPVPAGDEMPGCYGPGQNITRSKQVPQVIRDLGAQRASSGNFTARPVRTFARTNHTYIPS